MVPLISFTNVGFSYHPSLPVLHSITLSIPQGQSIVILGENGSGKSTLFLNLLHLVSGHSGAIEVAGLEVNHANEKAIRKQAGLIFQNSNDQLFLPTVREELAFGPWNLGKRGKELGEAIHHAAEAIGIADILDKKVFHLSQGEKKRVAIAAVYAMDPEIYLFDEPFANLDPKTRDDLATILADLHAQGKTLLMISHEVDQIPEFFERAAVLHAGEIIYDGPIRGLYQSPKILKTANLRIPLAASLFQGMQAKYPALCSEMSPQPPITSAEFEAFLCKIFSRLDLGGAGLPSGE